jgi:hypothetical protein
MATALNGEQHTYKTIETFTNYNKNKLRKEFF